MANLKETAQWEDGIYRIEQTDPVVGGEDGIDNIQAKQLGNRTLYLRKKLEEMEGTVDGYAPDMQEALFAGLKLGLDLGALAMKEHEQTRLTRFQEIRATIKNRGIKSGVTLSKSSTATRNISCSDGVVFMNGREYPVANQTNTASVASNTTEKSGVVIIYMFVRSSDVRAQLCLALVFSGALGNFIDRLRFGYVRDFLSFRIFGWDFPVFNIADICITVGFGCLIACMIYDEIQERKRWRT